MVQQFFENIRIKETSNHGPVIAVSLCKKVKMITIQPSTRSYFIYALVFVIALLATTVADAASTERRCEGIIMPDWLEFVLYFASYFALMRWVLPRFGVPT